MPDDEGFTIVAAESDSDKRLDYFIASHFANCSRKRATSLIKKGLIQVSGSARKPGFRISPGDTIQGIIPAPVPVSFQPEPIELCILYEDTHIIIINKPPGMVVHPAPGHYSGTLVNALLYHCPDLEGIGGELRPGIVHRLDKGTSGVMAVAKNQTSHLNLASQFKSRNINKEYLAIVYGNTKAEEDVISLPIGRHPTDRKKMSTHSHKPRDAETSWRVKERFNDFSLLTLKIMTGRTHQIRVHLTTINHPIVGDPVYGSRKAGQRIKRLKDKGPMIKKVERQMLHSFCLELKHPHTGESMRFEAPIPDDMQVLTDGLRD